MFELVHKEAVMPTRATAKSAGYDLTAVSMEWDNSGCRAIYDTGVKLKDIPEGHYGLIVARSSIVKLDIRLANGVGVIDGDYEDTIKVVFDLPLVAACILSKGNAKYYFPGDKIAQLVFVPYNAGETVTTERTGGFGSTDKPKKVK